LSTFGKSLSKIRFAHQKQDNVEFCEALLSLIFWFEACFDGLFA